MTNLGDLKVGLVHDWLTGLRGGEKVLECLAEEFPKAKLYSLLRTAPVSPAVDSLDTILSPIQKLPSLAKLYRHYLPLYPWAITKLDLANRDLVVSTSHCVAKGVVTGPNTVHVAYVFTPMRYVWDMYSAYFGHRNILIRMIMPFLAALLRQWDRRTSHRPDRMACISRHVAERIKRHWNRDSVVIHPPVEFDRFRTGSSGDYYLAVSALAPYKGLDVAIQAANEAGFKLIVAGDGQDYDRLKAMAGPTVTMAGRVSNEDLVELYANCRAFIFPGEEDFGITVLEAMASGKPTIALGRGGVWDTVIPLNPDQAPIDWIPQGDPPGPTDQPTGLFFYQPTAQALTQAIKTFEAHPDIFDVQALRNRAAWFDRARFKDRFMAYLEKVWADHND